MKTFKTDAVTPDAEIDGTDRRSFLRNAVVAAGASTAAAAAYGAGTSDDTVTPEEKSVDSKGYRETDHVREYYRLARF